MTNFRNLSSSEAINQWIAKVHSECKASYPLPPPGLQMRTAIDIGANVGGFCLHAHNRFEKIYAFEPLRENFLVLNELLKQTDITNVEAFNNAVHSKSGKTLNLVKGSTGCSGDVSCYENFDQKDDNFSGICETISLSDILDVLEIEHVDYLKIDCEGSEYDIFENFEDFSKISLIVMEMHGVLDQTKKQDLLEKLGQHYIIIKNNIRGLIDMDSFLEQYEKNGQDPQEFIEDVNLIFRKKERK
jgi:FkbM family methyltransferase